VPISIAEIHARGLGDFDSSGERLVALDPEGQTFLDHWGVAFLARPAPGLGLGGLVALQGVSHDHASEALVEAGHLLRAVRTELDRVTVWVAPNITDPNDVTTGTPARVARRVIFAHVPLSPSVLVRDTPKGLDELL
jgi:hypothetical protein